MIERRYLESIKQTEEVDESELEYEYKPAEYNILSSVW